MTNNKAQKILRALVADGNTALLTSDRKLLSHAANTLEAEVDDIAESIPASKWSDEMYALATEAMELRRVIGGKLMVTA